MNKWNRLLASLDRVFGMNNKERSTFKKLSQEFDEKTNEHVIVIEYRVRVKGTVKSTPRKNSGNRGFGSALTLGHSDQSIQRLFQRYHS